MARNGGLRIKMKLRCRAGRKAQLRKKVRRAIKKLKES